MFHYSFICILLHYTTNHTNCASTDVWVYANFPLLERLWSCASGTNGIRRYSTIFVKSTVCITAVKTNLGDSNLSYQIRQFGVIWEGLSLNVHYIAYLGIPYFVDFWCVCTDRFTFVISVIKSGNILSYLLNHSMFLTLWIALIQIM